ncbi:hypothetical protein [Marinomonas gallaica]|uniref:hypothetical protein n=1 Tax=Marinomonas gallaica TaxID=1806667 RepID=UPI003A8CBE1B
MSAQIADFNIRFNTETAKFQKDVDYAKKMLRGYTKEAKAANDSNLSLGRSLEQTADRAKSAGRGVLDAAGYVSAGIGAVTGATAYLITQQAQQAREVEKMATVAQVSVQQIQALAYASEQYNISGESMADILKDVNDKLGDFTENEGGEFADFMTNIAPTVGLTIDQLQKLSGPEALVAVKAAMDEANVPMKSQIFYLESIANDASALMPLLDDQGRKLYELTKKYDDLNVSMSEYDIEKFKEMDQKLKDTGLKLQRSFANAVLGASDQIDWFSDKLAYSINYWGTLFDSWSDNPRTENGLSKRISELRSEVTKLTKEKKELDKRFKEYENVDIDSLPPLSLLGKSKNDYSNINSSSWLNDKKLSEAQAEHDRLQKRYNVIRFGMNYDKPQPGLKPEDDTPERVIPEDPNAVANQQASGASRLASLDMQYADEREKLLLAHEQRVTDIENLKLSEQEIEKRGFDSLEAIKAEYKEREKEFYATEREEYELQQEEAIQREIDAFARKEDEKNKKAEEAARQRAAVEDRIEKSVLSMKLGVASQGLALIEQSAKKGSALRKAAFIAQKGMAAAQVWMQGEVAAAAALAPPPIGLGPIAGAGQATVIRALSAVSAGMIMGQAIAGMAHSGISEIPEEGTWLLNRGERVYTNQSANQIDQMYSAIMAMHQQPFAAIDPSRAIPKAAMVGGGRNIVNIYGAPEGTKVQDRQGENGENFTDVFLEDLDSDGPMSQGITQYFDTKRVGV